MEEQQPKPYVIGLDLGGTNAVFGIVNQRGEILATSAIKTQAYKKVEDFVDAGVKLATYNRKSRWYRTDKGHGYRCS